MKPARSPSPKTIAAALAIAAACAALPAYAARYWTREAVLSAFFPGSTRIGYKPISLSDAEAEAIGKKLGTAPVNKDWYIFLPETNGKRDDGYAIVKDSQIGLHEPIDFAVRFDGKGAVTRVEIMEYREAYGEEVRSDRFRAQFAGKTAGDAIIAGKDIDIVSGASYSSRSVALGVKRDVLVLDTALKSGKLSP
jgi:Na+-translocating ferredoxin:NAD+ oxidoreductase subunit G